MKIPERIEVTRGSWTVLASLLLVLLFVSACGTPPKRRRARAAPDRAPTHVVESTMVDPQELTSPEVSNTSAYPSLASHTKKVAVIPPASCDINGAARVSGWGGEASEMAGTRCAVQVGELERELSARGYSVVAWSVVDSKRSATGSSSSEAAKALGIDALFLVNSVEIVAVPHDPSFTWRRALYTLDDNGGNATLTPLEDVVLGQVDAHVGLMERAGAKRILPTHTYSGALIDATVVSVESGQPVWFFRGLRLKPHPTSDVVATYLRKGKTSWHTAASPLEAEAERQEAEEQYQAAREAQAAEQRAAVAGLIGGAGAAEGEKRNAQARQQQRANLRQAAARQRQAEAEDSAPPRPHALWFEMENRRTTLALYRGMLNSLVAEFASGKDYGLRSSADVGAATAPPSAPGAAPQPESPPPSPPLEKPAPPKKRGG